MGLTANELSPSKATGGSNPLASAVADSSATQLKTCARSSTDRASDYGSEGWGFESLRARSQLGHGFVGFPACQEVSMLSGPRPACFPAWRRCPGCPCARRARCRRGCARSTSGCWPNRCGYPRRRADRRCNGRGVPGRVDPCRHHAGPGRKSRVAIPVSFHPTHKIAEIISRGPGQVGADLGNRVPETSPPPSPGQAHHLHAMPL
jgi:hypothetical protein